jgi:hypothetical protein
MKILRQPGSAKRSSLGWVRVMWTAGEQGCGIKRSDFAGSFFHFSNLEEYLDTGPMMKNREPKGRGLE